MTKGGFLGPTPVPLQAAPLPLSLTDQQTSGVPHGCSETLGEGWTPGAAECGGLAFPASRERAPPCGWAGHGGLRAELAYRDASPLPGA